MMGKLMILAEKTENGWVAWAQGVDTHGSGGTLIDAIENFADELFFYIHTTVHENPESLGVHMRQQRAMLMDILGSEDK